MARNERTSARAAQIAGILLEMSDAQLRKWIGMKRPYVASVLADIRTIAASALTQAPDKALPADSPYAADYKPQTRKWRKTDPHLLYVETHVGTPKRKLRPKAKRRGKGER